MKTNWRWITAWCITAFVTGPAVAQHSLQQIWETETQLKVPESVLFDAANKVLYVSNIDGKPDGKDGKGSIGRVELDGSIREVDWVSGLNAPKGMALVKQTLWVADVDQVVAIDIRKGEIIRRIPIEGARFLNDVAADLQGRIYVSDSQTKKVHRIEKGVPTVVLENLEGPNGLMIHRRTLYVLDNGKLLKQDAAGKLVKIADGLEGHTDGIEHVGNDEFVVSAWTGVLYYVGKDGKVEKMLDTRDQKIHSADIGYDAKNRVVYVPTFYRNSVVAYKLQ